MFEAKKNSIEKAKTEKVVRIIQITDTHLSADQSALMQGLNTDESLADVVALIQAQEAHIDGFLCTGDISQDASVAAYRRFQKMVSVFSVPHLWIPGNHDIPERIEEALGAQRSCLNKLHTFANWQIIMLNSAVQDATHGHLAEAELSFLDDALHSAQAAGLHVLVCVHHNPVPVKAKWLQRICLRNSDAFFAVIDKYTHVKGVVFGHIHQVVQEERKGVLMMATPSTCVQFHPEADQFTLDDQNPGYRWLELSATGNIKTGVQRVEGKRYNVNLASAGY